MCLAASALLTITAQHELPTMYRASNASLSLRAKSDPPEHSCTIRMHGLLFLNQHPI